MAVLCGMPIIQYSARSAREIFAFSEKRTPYGKIFKILFQNFSSLNDRRVVFEFREIWPTQKI